MKRYRTLKAVVGAFALCLVLAVVVLLAKRGTSADSPISSLYHDSLLPPKTEDDGSTVTTTLYLQAPRPVVKDIFRANWGRIGR